MSLPVTYEAEYVVTARDSDCFSRCQAAALLFYLQETWGGLLAPFGFDHGFARKGQDASWMLARLKYTLEHPILLGDVLTIRLSCRDARGMGVYCDYELVHDGRRIGESLALWMLVDRQSRRYIPTNSMPELALLTETSAQNNKQLKRLILPDELGPAACKTVEYSQTDMNGHLHNAHYADLVCDVIGLDKLPGVYIAELQLSCLTECRLGSDIKLLLGRSGETWFVRGMGENKDDCFEAAVKLAQV